MSVSRNGTHERLLRREITPNNALPNHTNSAHLEDSDVRGPFDRTLVVASAILLMPVVTRAQAVPLGVDDCAFL